MLRDPALDIVRESTGGGLVVDPVAQAEIAGAPGLINGEAALGTVETAPATDGLQDTSAAELAYTEAIVTPELDDTRRSRFGGFLGKFASATSTAYAYAGVKYGNILYGTAAGVAKVSKGNETATRVAPAILPGAVAAGLMFAVGHMAKTDTSHMANHVAEAFNTNGGSGSSHSEVIQAHLTADISPASSGTANHLTSQAAETATANGGTGAGNHAVIHAELTAKTTPAVNDTPILESRTSQPANQIHLTADLQPSGSPVVLHAKPGQTVSEAYADLPGGFHQNWDQMVHDAKAAHLKEVHQNGIFYYVTPGGKSDETSVLKDMAAHSGGRVEFDSSSVAGSGGTGDTGAGAAGGHNGQDIISNTSGDTGIKLGADGHKVTFVGNNTAIRISLPGNELTHNGQHYFDIPIPQGAFHNDHLYLSTDQQLNMNALLHDHGMGGTITTAADHSGRVTGFNILPDGNFIDHSDLILPHGYTIESVSSDHTSMVIRTPGGTLVTVDTPNAWLNDQVGYDWGQVQDAIHNRLPKMLQEDNDPTSSIMIAVPPAARGNGGTGSSGSDNHPERGFHLTGLEVALGATGLGLAAIATAFIVPHQVKERRGRQRDRRIENIDVLVNPANPAANTYINRIRDPALFTEFNDTEHDEHILSTQAINGYVNLMLALLPDVTDAATIRKHLAAQGINVRGVQFEEVTGLPAGTPTRYQLADSVSARKRKEIAKAIFDNYAYLPPHDSFLGNVDTRAALDRIHALEEKYDTDHKTMTATEIEALEDSLEEQIQIVLDNLAYHATGHINNRNAAQVLLGSESDNVTYNKDADRVAGEHPFAVKEGHIHGVAENLAEYAPSAVKP